MAGRDFIAVARAVKRAIPDSEEASHLTIDSLINSVGFAAPELHNSFWATLSDEVNRVVGPPPLKHAWMIHTVAALIDKTEDETRELYGAK